SSHNFSDLASALPSPSSPHCPAEAYSRRSLPAHIAHPRIAAVPRPPTPARPARLSNLSSLPASCPTRNVPTPDRVPARLPSATRRWHSRDLRFLRTRAPEPGTPRPPTDLWQPLPAISAAPPHTCPAPSSSWHRSWHRKSRSCPWDRRPAP